MISNRDVGADRLLHPARDLVLVDFGPTGLRLDQHHEFVDAIEGNDDAARVGIGIDRPVHPGAAVADEFRIEIGDAHVDREELARPIGVLLLHIAFVGDAERLADEATRAVAADRIGSSPDRLFAAVGLGGAEADLRFVLGEPFGLPAEPHVDVRSGTRLRKEEAFDVHLVDVKHRLGKLVSDRHVASHGDPLIAVRHREAEDFVLAQPGEVALIERMIGRQAELAHLVGESELAVVLHRAGVLAIALGMPALVRLGVEDRRFHAVEIEEEREHKADRAAPHDRDRCRQCLVVSHRTCVKMPGRTAGLQYRALTAGGFPCRADFFCNRAKPLQACGETARWPTRERM